MNVFLSIIKVEIANLNGYLHRVLFGTFGLGRGLTVPAINA